MKSREEKPTSLSNKILNGVGWTYLSFMVRAGSQLIFIAVLSRLLEPRDFGLLGMALVCTNAAERFAQLGMGPAIVQRHELQDIHVSTARTTNIISGWVVALIVFFIAPMVADFFKEPGLVHVLQVLSALFVIEGMCTTNESWLSRKLQFKLLGFVDNISYFLGNCIVAIPLAAMGYGVWSLVFSQLTIRLLKCLVLLKIADAPVGLRFRRQSFKELVPLGAGFSLGRILNFLALQGDNLVVGRVLGAAALGLYSRIYQIMTIPAVYVAQVLDRVLFPALALKQADKAGMARGMYLLVEVVSICSMPLAVLSYLLPGEIVSILLGDRWLEGASVLQVFALGIFFRAGYKCGDTVLKALGAVYSYSGLQLLYAVFVVCGAFVGSFWGLEGVAWGVLLAVAINYVAMSALAAHLAGLRMALFFQAHLPGLWLGFWTGVATFAAQAIFGSLSLPHSAIGLIMLAAFLTALMTLVILPLSPSQLRPRVLDVLGTRFKSNRWTARVARYAKLGAA